MIYFHDRNTRDEINSSFFLVDGERESSYGDWHVGDTVTLLFDLTKEQFNAINRHRDELLEWAKWRGDEIPIAYEQLFEKYYILLPFTVVKRTHHAGWKCSGTLQVLNSSVYLESISDPWQEVFLWIVCGEVPKWAKEEEE